MSIIKAKLQQPKASAGWLKYSLHLLPGTSLRDFLFSSWLQGGVMEFCQAPPAAAAPRFSGAPNSGAASPFKNQSELVSFRGAASCESGDHPDYFTTHFQHGFLGSSGIQRSGKRYPTKPSRATPKQKST
jgi:hypothetical protein